ncbi:MAG: SDR family oxidoreductase [Pseudomonadales bacterium]
MTDQENTTGASHESQSIVIFGATSAVGQEVARLHAQREEHLILVARNESALAIVRDDLLARGAISVHALHADLADVRCHEALRDRIDGVDSKPARYYVFYGVLPDQKACEESVELTLSALNTNFSSVVSLLTPIVQQMEKQRSGALITVSSVAGDRGRQSNYTYGAAKGGLSLWMQGVRNRLSDAGCTVLNVKPGFIDTPMTAEIEKGGPLWAQPADVAQDIVKAADKGKSEIYTPWFWRVIMLIIKSIPEFIFKKLKL